MAGFRSKIVRRSQSRKEVGEAHGRQGPDLTTCRFRAWPME
jgi:hypothetical protein